MAKSRIQAIRPWYAITVDGELIDSGRNNGWVHIDPELDQSNISWFGTEAVMRQHPAVAKFLREREIRQSAEHIESQKTQRAYGSKETDANRWLVDHPIESPTEDQDFDAEKYPWLAIDVEERGQGVRFTAVSIKIASEADRAQERERVRLKVEQDKLTK